VNFTPTPPPEQTVWMVAAPRELSLAQTGGPDQARRVRLRAFAATRTDPQLSGNWVDGKMHVALVAVERGEHHRLAAVARLSLDPENPSEGELAIVVHDPFRREGLGAEMLRRLHDEASSRGVKGLRGMVQADNVPMRELLYCIFPDTRVAGVDGQEVDYLVPVH
jgi:GNAT superfamily N-acetyltransferase